VIDTVNEYAPNFKQASSRARFHALDMEREFGLTRATSSTRVGLDNCFCARDLGHGDYRAVKGCTTAGGRAPGGASPGCRRSCAREMIRDFRRRRA